MQDQHKIVIFDINSSQRDYLRSIIARLGYRSFCFEKETSCFDNLQSLEPELILFKPISLENAARFLHAVKIISPELPVILISNDNKIKKFIIRDCFKNVKRVNAPVKVFEIQKSIKKLLKKNNENTNNNYNPAIIGNSPEIRAIKKIIPELGKSPEAILIQGEAGTGKELIARAIYHAGVEKESAFVKVNAKDLSLEIIEKEIFGVYAGNVQTNKKNSNNQIKILNNRTILLDRIEKIPEQLQSKLLWLVGGAGQSRYWQDNQKPFTRIIATTDIEIGDLVEMGKFRKDLYYRLNVIQLDIPPLRERVDDISLLTDYFSYKYCIAYCKSCFEQSGRVKNIFYSYNWPGNIRELEEFVKDLVFRGDESWIYQKICREKDISPLPGFYPQANDIYALAEVEKLKNHFHDLSNLSLKSICSEFVSRAEKKMMKKALESTNWNRKKAAGVLDISYKSLLNKIKHYELRL